MAYPSSIASLYFSPCWTTSISTCLLSVLGYLSGSGVREEQRLARQTAASLHPALWTPELTPKVLEVGQPHLCSATEGGTDWPGHSATPSWLLSGLDSVFLQDAKWCPTGALAGFELPQRFHEQRVALNWRCEERKAWSCLCCQPLGRLKPFHVSVPRFPLCELGRARLAPS